MTNRTYHWCLNHGKAGIWAAHKPADCTMKGKKPAVENKFTKKQTDPAKTTYDLSNLKPNARLTAALSAIKKVSWAEGSDSGDDLDF